MQYLLCVIHDQSGDAPEGEMAVNDIFSEELIALARNVAEAAYLTRHRDQVR